MKDKRYDIIFFLVARLYWLFYSPTYLNIYHTWCFDIWSRYDAHESFVQGQATSFPRSSLFLLRERTLVAAGHVTMQRTLQGWWVLDLNSIVWRDKSRVHYAASTDKNFTHEPLPRFQNIKTLTLFKIILTQTLTPALNWVTAVVVRRKAFVVGFFSRILYGKNNFYIRWENVPWSLPKFELPSAFLTETVGMLKNHKSHKIIIQSKNLVSFCNKYWSIVFLWNFPSVAFLRTSSVPW